MKLKAKVTTAFAGRPDDEPVSRLVAVDEIITGDLAKVAIDEDWAEEVTGGSADDDAEEPVASPLDGLSAAKLKAYAAKNKIAIDPKLKARDHIRAAIEAAQAAK